VKEKSMADRLSIEAAMTLSALIALLEESREGSRGLDARVWAATSAAEQMAKYELAEGWHYETELFERRDGTVALVAVKDNERLIQAIRAAPLYTTSLDAALSLVPEGWAWTVSKNGTAVVVTESADPSKYRRENGHATWPALALVIAALKARRG
jgi:hypothetical protein